MGLKRKILQLDDAVLFFGFFQNLHDAVLRLF